MNILTETLTTYCEIAIIAKSTFISNDEIKDRIEQICSNIQIKAPIRFLLACSAAVIDNKNIDIRKPYTEIKGNDVFSGRSYDEKYIQHIVDKYDLPCNATTAFLTPAFRNRNTVLLLNTELVGRNPKLYSSVLFILNSVHNKVISAESLFKEIIRQLIVIRNRNKARINELLESLKSGFGFNALSSEQIVTLITQHLASKNSSRLPVLLVSAIYITVGNLINESIKLLHSHTAADKQTGAIGDIEVILKNDNNVVTSYEMKDKKVVKSDIDTAIKKIANSDYSIDNYIFITTDIIEQETKDYAKEIYEKSGIEVVILDCIGFLRHFLHFFHRHRTTFLENYQELVLKEPKSSVSQPLKELFLTLRKVAESGYN